MSRKNARQHGMRTRIAAAAERIMAEDGIDDYSLAKRKAARQLGAADTEALPANDEIEAELHAYRSLYQAEEHPERVEELRRLALDAMRLFQRFHPYLIGPVLAGTAGPYAAIELQLFPESTKDVEIFLLGEDIAYESAELRRYSGERARAVSLLKLNWKGVDLNISVYDPRDERVALKTSVAGKTIERAGISEVEGFLSPPKST